MTATVRCSTVSTCSLICSGSVASCANRGALALPAGSGQFPYPGDDARCVVQTATPNEAVGYLQKQQGEHDVS